MSKGITGLTAMAVAWMRDPEDPTSFRCVSRLQDREVL